MISEVAKKISSTGHIKKSLSTGIKGEELFKNAMIKNKIPFKLSSSDQNIREHIDIFMDGKGVDVKGLKKSHREGFLVIEFKNVQGKAGSCSDDSKAELIAFQMINYFIVLRKEEILDYCRANVSNEYVDSFSKAYKKLYTRNGRKDLMTKLHIEDVEKFNYILMLKY